MAKIKQFRDVNEKDVINLYAFSGTVGTAAGDSVPAGTLVKIQGAGWKASDEPFGIEGTPGTSFGNTVSNRYATTAKVSLCGTGDAPIGITLYDIKEVDENGEPLKFNPRKAAEIEAVISGQTVPVATKGIFLYSGSTLTGVTAGSTIYAGASGELETVGSVAVGKALGNTDSNGYTLIRIAL